MCWRQCIRLSGHQRRNHRWLADKPSLFPDPHLVEIKWYRFISKNDEKTCIRDKKHLLIGLSRGPNSGLVVLQPEGTAGICVNLHQAESSERRTGRQICTQTVPLSQRVEIMFAPRDILHYFRRRVWLRSRFVFFISDLETRYFGNLLHLYAAFPTVGAAVQSLASLAGNRRRPG